MHRTYTDELVHTLATKVRAFTEVQLAYSPWFRHAQSPATTVRRRTQALMQHGLLVCQTILVEPLIPLTQPVFTWKPGQPDPEFGAVAWRLQSRWPNAPAVPTTIYFTSLKANRLYGGPPHAKRIRLEHELHDLSMGSVYLHYLDHDSEIAARWIGEDLLPTSGFRMCDVDALAQLDDGQLVIEFGGRYDARRVEHFHHDCARRRRRYDLW